MKAMCWEEELRLSHPEDSCAINMVTACRVALPLEEHHHPLYREVRLVINKEEELHIVRLQEPRILQLQEEVRDKDHLTIRLEEERRPHVPPSSMMSTPG